LLIEHRHLEVARGDVHDPVAVSDYSVAPDHIGHRFTTRIDLADCLLRQAVDGT